MEQADIFFSHENLYLYSIGKLASNLLADDLISYVINYYLSYFNLSIQNIESILEVI